MTLVIGSNELHAVARSTYTWVDNLTTMVERAGRWRGQAEEAATVMESVSKDAVRISWGTPDSTSRELSRLITSINDVAINAGTVDALTGATKPRDLHEALAAAKRAHGAVQQAMQAHGWQGKEYYWPT